MVAVTYGGAVQREPSRHRFASRWTSKLTFEDVVHLSIIERAYEMASSGDYPSLELIERALAKEGYEGAYLHLRSPALRSELKLRMRGTNTHYAG